MPCASAGWTLGIAESLTAGLVAARLGSVPGVSDVLRGSLVTYASDVKFDLLGVTPGPVISEEVALEMAEGACRVLGADVGLALTGVAGPDTPGRRPGGNGVPRRRRPRRRPGDDDAPPPDRQPRPDPSAQRDQRPRPAPPLPPLTTPHPSVSGDPSATGRTSRAADTPVAANTRAPGLRLAAGPRSSVWIEQRTSNPPVARSNRAGGAINPSPVAAASPRSTAAHRECNRKEGA